MREKPVDPFIISRLGRNFSDCIPPDYENPQIAILKRHIQRLPERQRQIVKLFLKDKPVSEIARIKKIHQSTVSNTLKKAILNLQAKMLKK